MKTTDPQDEIFPVVNEKDEVIGKITRKEAHKSPHIIHRAVAILVFNGQGNLLVQKRSLTKDTCPGYWSHSVGGHVGYTKEYLPVAVRETQEELGITVSPKNLQLLGKIITTAPWEKETTQVYKYIVMDNPSLQPLPEEVSEVKFVDITTLKEMLKTENWTPSSLQVFQAFVLL